MPRLRKASLISLGTIIILLSACGGSSGSSNNDTIQRNETSNDIQAKNNWNEGKWNELNWE